MKEAKDNTAVRVLIVSTFPPKDTADLSKTGGLARFMDIVLKHMDELSITVLSEKFSPKDPPFTNTNGHTIVPTWKRGSVSGLFDIVRSIFASDFDLLLLNHDFGVFGSMITTILFPFVILCAHLKTRTIVLIQHSGLTDVASLSGHLQLAENDIRLKLYSLGVRIELIFFSLLCKKIIVTEEKFKERIAALPFVTRSKIDVIPLPYFPSSTTHVATVKIPESTFTVLFFGFLTWYKGADWLVSCTHNPQWPQDALVIMAGGQTINQENSQYYNKLESDMHNSPRIHHTGFIPEEAIQAYFQKADIVILPYRVMMSASGPLAMAIAYKKPFLISQALSPYAEAKDFRDALSRAHLTTQDITFPLEEEAFIDKIKSTLNPDTLAQLQQVTSFLHESRSPEKVGAKYQEMITSIAHTS